MAGGASRAFQLADGAICSRAAESLACSSDCAGGTSAGLLIHTDTALHTPRLGTAAELSLRGIICFSEGLLQCNGALRPLRTCGGGRGCPGEQLGTAGGSQVTQMLKSGSGRQCQVSTVSEKNYTLEMPLSVGQCLEGQLRLDFQLLGW